MLVDEVVTYERASGVATITINRPEAANALNAAVRRGLVDAWREFEADEHSLVAILTGAGDRAFCAGADLRELAENSMEGPAKDWVPIIGENIEVSKPTIAAVNGAAMAGGFLMAQMCDLCVASENARFGITEAKWGRGMAWAVPLLWMVPERAVTELLLTAQPISAERGYELGLVNRVVHPAKLLEVAETLATTIAENAPLTIGAALRVIRRRRHLTGMDEVRDLAEAEFEVVYASEDAQEGPQAFKAGRAPVWRGR